MGVFASDDADLINVPEGQIFLDVQSRIKLYTHQDYTGQAGDYFVILSSRDGVTLTGGATLNDVLDFTWADLGGELSWGYGLTGDNTGVWVEVVPEPGTLSLLALGGLAVLRKRRRRA